MGKKDITIMVAIQVKATLSFTPKNLERRAVPLGLDGAWIGRSGAVTNEAADARLEQVESNVL
ncbi:MAG: hypothetical protein ABID54_01315 [Pseudomonadota bacterium]